MPHHRTSLLRADRSEPSDGRGPRPRRSPRGGEVWSLTGVFAASLVLLLLLAQSEVATHGLDARSGWTGGVCAVCLLAAQPAHPSTPTLSTGPFDAFRELLPRPAERVVPFPIRARPSSRAPPTSHT